MWVFVLLIIAFLLGTLCGSLAFSLGIGWLMAHGRAFVKNKHGDWKPYNPYRGRMFTSGMEDINTEGSK